jgi:uncharacterized protein YigA (DUF484 family)
MTSPISGDTVAQYLRDNPSFFDVHAELLASVTVPHPHGGRAVSLVERQVLVLRDRHAVLERKLHELIENGRTNDAIADRMHRLTRRLLRARDAAGVLAGLETSLREDFGASRWVLLAIDPTLASLGNVRSGHVRVVPRGSPELKIFETFFESGRPRSGQIRDTQRDYLFGGEGSQVGSTVLIPLGDRAGLGILAIASNDTERYLPTMSTDFLVRIGEIVTEAVSARLA